MPIYEYRCRCGWVGDAIFPVDAIQEGISCGACGGFANRAYSAPAVHFKGSGFYTTDHAKNRGSSVKTDSQSGSAQETKAAADKALDKKKAT